jgi:hypothetical protein
MERVRYEFPVEPKLAARTDRGNVVAFRSNAACRTFVVTPTGSALRHQAIDACGPRFISH